MICLIWTEIRGFQDFGCPKNYFIKLSRTQTLNLWQSSFMAHFEAKPHMIPERNPPKNMLTSKVLLDLHKEKALWVESFMDSAAFYVSLLRMHGSHSHDQLFSLKGIGNVVTEIWYFLYFFFNYYFYKLSFKFRPIVWYIFVVHICF